MKKITLLFASLFALNFVALAQSNLVPNSSFETYTTCPDFSGQLNYVNDWNNVNLVYGNFSYGSPDFYNTCSTDPLASLPNNNYGTVTAFDGNSVVGLVIYNYDIVDYREYMSAQLSQQLNPENTYNIKFRMTGGTNQGYRFHSHNFGIVFSQTPLAQATWSIINEVPQVEIDTMLNTSTWQEYSFTYTPDKTYDYITLGSFRHDADINAVFSQNSVNKYSYVYIDAIEIKDANQTGLSNNTISDLKLQYINNNIIISNPDKVLINSIVITDIQGRLIQTESLNKSDNTTIDLTDDLSSGVYFATINSTLNSNTYKFVVSK
jgi:hypothetical protein